MVDDVKTLCSTISISTQKHDVLACVHDDCEVCKTELEKCEELKDCVQELINQGILQFSRDKTLEEVYVIEPIEIVYRKKQIEAPMKKV